jgi:hypothetical protein
MHCHEISPHIADEATSNFRVEFFPYRACNTPPYVAAEKFARSVAPRQCSPVFCECEDRDACVLIFLCFNFVPFRTCSIKHLFPTARPDESLHSRIMKWLAVNRGSRFTRGMSTVDTTGSKLCAVRPRHAQIARILSARLRSTWQGEGKALSVASSPICRARRVESLPLSTLSGARAVTAFHSAGEVKGNA